MVTSIAHRYSLMVLARDAYSLRSASRRSHRIYIVLSRIIRSVDAEHLSSMRTKRLTLIFVMNDVLCFLTQIFGAGVQVTGDAHIMNIGKKVVLAGLVFSLVVFAFFILIAVKFHIRLKKTPSPLVSHSNLRWQRYMWALYTACVAIMLRNLVQTIQFGSKRTAPINTQEVYIYVFDAFMMFFAMLVLIIYHPGLLIKKARHMTKADEFNRPLTTDAGSGHVLLTEYEPQSMRD